MLPFVSVHNHTEYSPLDGLSTCDEAARRAAEDGSPALAITDHGGCFGHPHHQAACDAVGIKPLFGIETYFRPDRLIRPAPGDQEAQQRLIRGNHLILLARGDKGLRDLWAASTEANATGFYGKPRMDWAILEEYGSDWIATTACLGGIISKDLMAGNYPQAWDTLDRLNSIFRNRLYLEIQANDLPDQVRLNRMLVLASEQFGIPLVAASDAHYPSEKQASLHKIWMQCQSGKGNDDYWNFSAMLTPDRTREILLSHGLDARVVDESMRNTLVIAEQCTARISGYADPPVFTPGGTAADDARLLRAMLARNRDRGGDTQEYRDREEREFALVADKGLAGCYLIVEEIVRWVRSQGILVGPGRGSAAGSLMSYRLGITSPDPIRAGLLFERFLTPGRVSLPDFDLDFPASKRGVIQGHVIDRYGSDHVVRVGTHTRYGAKGILNKLFKVLEKDVHPDSPGDAIAVARTIDELNAGTAGLGLPWDEIVAEPALQDYLAKYRRVFTLAAHFQGRLYTYGQHPAGLIISPGNVIAGTMPMRVADTSNKELLVSEFDYRYADAHGYLKLDLLTLRTMDTVQYACELIAKRTGTMPDPRDWDAEHGDPQVYDVIGRGETLGMFQFETSLCTSYAARHRPRDLNGLSDLTTYIRPGPRNSGAADSYLRRHAGQEEVDYPHELLAEHLERSYGLMLYQEDILIACRVLAGYDDLEADGVRKILGKKLTSKIESAGKEFTERCVARGHDRAQMEALWEKIAEFGKYAFNRAHGYSYGTLSYWTAWLKVHYPVELLTAVLSTLDDKDRMAAFATEARRIGLTVLPPDVRTAGGGFTYEGLTIQYGLSAIKHVGPGAISKIVANQPYSSLEDFKGRSGVNAGVLYHLARAGALDALTPSRRGLLRVIEADKDGSSVRCVHKAEPGTGPGGLPCAFGWDSEPQPAPRISPKTGKQLKVYPLKPPARCTVKCRHYTPPRSMDPAAMAEHTPAELFRMDMETYGCWMHPAPFDQLEAFGPGTRGRSRQMALMVHAAPPGSYPLEAVYAGCRTATTRKGDRMWWVQLATEVSMISLACFSPYRDDEPDVPALLPRLRAGTLVVAEVIKRPYNSPGRGTRMGWNLANLRVVA